MSTLTAKPISIQVKPTSSLYMISVLGAISALCGLVIVVSYQMTASAIRQNLATITSEAVAEIVPQAKKQVIFAVDPATGDLTKLSGLEGDLPKIFAAYDDGGQLVAVACEAAGRGYGDVIKVLYAYSPDQQAITGFKVLDLKETPGLGDKIVADPDFLANFKELDVTLGAGKQKLEHDIVAVKHGEKAQKWEIDGISGATISSKAVARLLNQGAAQMVPVIMKNLDRLRKGE